ncbi:pyridoxal-phosphate-dependent aminotransferase family protein [Ligilactobacillus ruminis]|uniref:pyridoxal-phosphate-dependent aminotransferase family protein n=1 Tax=Ligilactobacillus ruminis TaxID=1623 RepID=UPI0022E6B73B|nr:aminotransferase class V-fold PLP-dependent enzyme [Ligilactobacillus ruminis]
MINFTVGPVMSSKEILEIGGQQVPYFRTSEFSEIMFENEKLMSKFAKAPTDSRTVFITGSGTAAMEATVMNVFDGHDKVLIVDGGSFGHRFVQLCEIHHIPYETVIPKEGYSVTEEQLSNFDNKGFTGFLVNLDETSKGVLYDIDVISAFCKRNNLFLVVDSISSFLCDEFDMDKLNVQVMITGSQKALACPPGVSMIVLSPQAVERVYSKEVESMYFDLKSALKNGERGQTPFTPAVGILLQINARLKQIEKNGGVDQEIMHTAAIAKDFRNKIECLPFEITSKSLSNAVTPLHPLNVSAYDIFKRLKNEYGIWVCPNGGELSEKVFRVGHIGCLTFKDNDKLIDAFKDMQGRGLI